MCARVVDLVPPSVFWSAHTFWFSRISYCVSLLVFSCTEATLNQQYIVLDTAVGLYVCVQFGPFTFLMCWRWGLLPLG